MEQLLQASGSRIEKVHVLTVPWAEASQRTQRLHLQQASEAVSTVLQVFAPGDSYSLWKYLRESKEASVAEHCRQYALSDGTDNHTTTCSHQHVEACEACDSLQQVLDSLEESFTENTFPTSEEHDDMRFTLDQAKRDINAWQCHQLRSINQDEAWSILLDNMDDTSVLLVMDWAMKFLPRNRKAYQRNGRSHHQTSGLLRPTRGKGSCDRQAATVKSHIKTWINEGHDVETAEEFKIAVESRGGIPGVKVFLCEVGAGVAATSVKLDGIIKLNNFEFSDAGLRVWRAYNIGEGNLIPWPRLPAIEPPLLKIVSQPSNPGSAFRPIKPRQKKVQAQQEVESDSDEDAASHETVQPSLFPCPEESCVKVYQTCKGLEAHVAVGKHKRRLERETLLDKAKLKYAEKLAQGPSVPHVEPSLEVQDFLTGQQVSSYFSRLAAKRRKPSEDSEEEEQQDTTAIESSNSRIQEAIITNVQLCHPVLYDPYNLCDLAKMGNLYEIGIEPLKSICQHFDVDVSSITDRRRKAAFVAKLREYLSFCSCSKSK
uniref:C2H2-type domain-containing protein n=1 Tax=Branchiostoma floridae TaxID=7739 RepID=C3ZT56_BRAFL|eukprot:XP_002588251.1 hypothetical protein BRAFLDRAFT_124704 [Branchiostoma floridae]